MIDPRERATQLTYKFSKGTTYTRKSQLFTLRVGSKEQVTELYMPDKWFLRKLPDWIEPKGKEDFLILCKGMDCDYHAIGSIFMSLIKLGYTISGEHNKFYQYFHAYKGN